MVEIKRTGNVYFYGKHYYPSESNPCPNSEKRTNGIVVYTAPVKYNKKVSLGSLEGLFICDEFIDTTMNNTVIARDEMKEFAESYHGEFVTFRDHGPIAK